MGGEGNLNTTWGLGSSAAGRIQHSQDLSWQARQKPPGLVRPQTTRSYRLLWAEETKPTRECCKPGALDPPQQHTKMPADCYKNAPMHWSQTGGKGRQWSCRELLTETTWRVSTVDWRKCGDPRRRDLFTWNQQMEWRPSLIARELWQDGVNTSRNYSTSLATYITKLWTISCSALPSLNEIPTVAEMARAIADTVGRTGLWQLLRKYGYPEKFTTVIEALHTGMMANVSVGGEVSESFGVTNGVKQDCVLAPTLFSIFLSAMLDEAFWDMGDGIYI